MSAHEVSDGWKMARREALATRAVAVSDCLDHLTDVEEMLEAEGRDHASGSMAASTIPQDIRSLASRLRSLRSDYESEAARAGG